MQTHSLRLPLRLLQGRLSAVAHHNSHNLIGCRHLTKPAASADPIQKLFFEKLQEYKKSNKGLSDKYKVMLEGELTRLKRVYKVDNEAKLAKIEHNFPKTANVVVEGLHPESENK